MGQMSGTLSDFEPGEILRLIEVRGESALSEKVDGARIG